MLYSRRIGVRSFVGELSYTFLHFKRRFNIKLNIKLKIKLKQNKPILLYTTTTTNIMTELIRIPNIENYTQEIINGELILTPKKQYMTENELNNTQITNSTIEECLIKKEEETISINTSYRSVLVDIWKSMPSQKILQTTTFNFKLTNENGVKGYTWCDDIHMSFQNKDARGTLKEILNMVKVNKLTIKLSIKLETGRIVHFKIE